MSAAWACALCRLGPPDVAPSKRKRALCDVCFDGLIARGLAWCSRCNRRQAQADMAPGRQWCVICERARRAQQRTPEALALKAAKSRAAYWADHAAQIERRRASSAQRVEQQRRWRKENPDRAREQYRTYYRRHQAERIAYSRAWRAANAEHARRSAAERRQRAKLRILQSWRLSAQKEKQS